MNRKKVIYWIIGLAAIFLVFRVVTKFIVAFSEQSPYSEVQLNEYQNLVPELQRSKLKVVWNYNSKKRNQFSLFDYGENRKYSLIVYKIPTADGFKTSNISISKDGRDRTRKSEIYTNVNNGISELLYLSGGSDPVNQLSIFYDGDSLKEIAFNDSIVAYYLNSKRIDFCINKQKFADFYEGPKNEAWALPTNLLILKRNGYYYLMILTVNRINDTLPEDLLFRIITDAV